MARTVPGIGKQFAPLEDRIRQSFIPALTGQEIERKLFALPSRLGGLGILNPVEVADEQHVASNCITAPLVALIALQVSSIGSAVEEVKKARNRTRS